MIKITFTYTPADIRSGATLLARKRYRIMRLVLVALGVFILFCAAASHCSESGSRNVLVFCGILFVIFVDVVVPLINRYNVTRHVRRNKGLFFDQRTMEIDEKGIVTTIGETRSERPWKTIIGYRMGKRIILLYLSKDYAFSIPRSVFLDQSDETDLIRLLREKDIPEI